jgi:hypothetical protein
MTAIRWSALLLFLVAHPARALDITACGQVVPAGDVGVLQADLDCGGSWASCFGDAALACAQNPACTDTGCGGFLLRDQATLQMNGHTVANGVVVCPYKISRTCSVVGPGSVVGGYGVAAFGNLNVSGGLDVHDGIVGINVHKGKVSLQDVTVSAVSNYAAIQIYGKLQVTNVTSNGSGVGVFVDGTLLGTGLTTNDNDDEGVEVTKRMDVTGLTATGNGVGEPDGNGGILSFGTVKLTDSQVTGNFFHGTQPRDLYTRHKPRLFNSTCEHSAKWLPHFGTTFINWEVCSQD